VILFPRRWIDGIKAVGSKDLVRVVPPPGRSRTWHVFEPGSSSFRYVADSDYSNLARGSNTYTIVATDSVGNSSNTIVLTITAEF
jgi:hypothetical protein